MPLSDPAVHYLWGQGCEGWRRCDRDELSVIEELMPPGTAEHPHLHRHATQFFHVLSGLATMRLTEGETVVPAGQGLSIPPGTTHQMRNDSLTPLRFLVISAPNTAGDRIEQDL